MQPSAAPRMMIGGLLALVMGVGVLDGAAWAQAPAGGAKRGPQNFALASDIVAREIAFARAAREKGQWKAFRDFAADDAQMFAGTDPVRVQAWAKGRKDPTEPLQWTASSVWMSCDGSVGVSYGTWHAGTAKGWFSTVWQRQKRGDYRFLLDQGGDGTADAKPDDELPVIEAKVADCPARGAKPMPVAVEPATKSEVDHLSGESADHTLAWATTLGPDGKRAYVVRIKQGADMVEVLRR